MCLTGYAMLFGTSLYYCWISMQGPFANSWTLNNAHSDFILDNNSHVSLYADFIDGACKKYGIPNSQCYMPGTGN